LIVNVQVRRWTNCVLVLSTFDQGPRSCTDGNFAGRRMWGGGQVTFLNSILPGVLERCVRVVIFS